MSQQLPLPYEPPEVSEPLAHLKAIAAHHSSIREAAERLLTAYRAFEAGSPEAIQTLTNILEQSEQVQLLVSLVQVAMTESGRQNDLLRAQRNEVIRERDEFFRALSGVLTRFQRKAHRA